MVSHWLPKGVDKQCMNTQTFVFFFLIFTKSLYKLKQSCPPLIYLHNILGNNKGKSMRHWVGRRLGPKFSAWLWKVGQKQCCWDIPLGGEVDGEPGERAAFGVYGTDRTQVGGCEARATAHSLLIQNSVIWADKMDHKGATIRDLPQVPHITEAPANTIWDD